MITAIIILSMVILPGIIGALLFPAEVAAVAGFIGAIFGYAGISALFPDLLNTISNILGLLG